MNGGQNGAFVNRISLADLLSAVGYTIDKQTDAVMKKAGAVMHMLGWEKKRSSQEGRPWVYVRPGHESGAKAEPGASEGSSEGAALAPVHAEGSDDPPF